MMTIERNYEIKSNRKEYKKKKNDKGMVRKGHDRD
jgi:hypothetical protein